MGRDDLSLSLTPEPPATASAVPLAKLAAGGESRSEAGPAGSPEPLRLEREAPPAASRLGTMRLSETPAGQAAMTHGRRGELPWGSVAVVLAASALVAILRPPDLIWLLLFAWLLLFGLAAVERE